MDSAPSDLKAFAYKIYIYIFYFHVINLYVIKFYEPESSQCNISLSVSNVT